MRAGGSPIFLLLWHSSVQPLGSTHGSGSRLFTMATKLWGIKPSWPVVSDCAFHHSPLLQGHGPVSPEPL